MKDLGRMTQEETLAFALEAATNLVEENQWIVLKHLAHELDEEEVLEWLQSRKES